MGVKGKILTAARKEIGRRELNNLIEQLAEAVKPPSTKRRHFYFEFAQAMLEVPLEAVDEGALTREELVFLLLASIKVVWQRKEPDEAKFV